VLTPQLSNALRAARTASSTSSTLDTGAWAITSPVEGLITSSVRSASTNSPPMKFCSLLPVTVAILSLSVRVVLIAGSQLPFGIAWVAVAPAPRDPGSSLSGSPICSTCSGGT
jgi:hypothetical protein